MLTKTISTVALGLTVALNAHASDIDIATSLETALPDEAYHLIDAEVRAVDYTINQKVLQQAKSKAKRQAQLLKKQSKTSFGVTINRSPATNLTDFTFTDVNLGACVTEKAAQYGWQTVADVASLKCEGRQIDSIADLSVFTSLQVISMTDNNISDLSPIANLPYVSHLFMGSNNLDNADLAYVPSSVLDLIVSDNQLDDLSYLPALPSLRGFHASKNNISNIEPLRDKLTLEVLLLDNNSINEIGPVSGLFNLRTLFLQGNALTNSLYGSQPSNGSYLSWLPNLTRLNLSNNQITSIDHWTFPQSLEWLLMSHNQIQNIEPLEDLINLTLLDLNFNQIVHTIAIDTMVSLKTLYLAFNQLEQVGFSSSELTTLLLNNNNLRDIANLEHMTKLKVIYLQYNRMEFLYVLDKFEAPVKINVARNLMTDCENVVDLVRQYGTDVVYTGLPCNFDFTPIAELTFNDPNLAQCISYMGSGDLSETVYDFKVLHCGYFGVTDISDLGQLNNLEELDLEGNQISDIDSIAQLTFLKSVRLLNNNIDTLPDLSLLTNLRSIELEDNNISDISVFAFMPWLEWVWLTNNSITNIDSLFNLVNPYAIELHGNDVSCEDVNRLKEALVNPDVVGAPC